MVFKLVWETPRSIKAKSFEKDFSKKLKNKSNLKSNFRKVKYFPGSIIKNKVWIRFNVRKTNKFKLLLFVC